MGTPKYCSPEQLQGKDLDNRSDIYSLGMIMYLMLCKKLPWNLEVESVGLWYKAHTELSPKPFPPELNISSDLEKLVLQCLEKSPSNRPQNVGEIIQRLESIAKKLKIVKKTISEGQNHLLNINNNFVESYENTNPKEDFFIISSMAEE